MRPGWYGNFGIFTFRMCKILHYRQIKPWLYPDFTFNLTKYRGIQDKLLDTIHTLTKKVCFNHFEKVQKKIAFYFKRSRP